MYQIHVCSALLSMPTACTYSAFFIFLTANVEYYTYNHGLSAALVSLEGLDMIRVDGSCNSCAGIFIFQNEILAVKQRHMERQWVVGRGEERAK